MPFSLFKRMVRNPLLFVFSPSILIQFATFPARTFSQGVMRRLFTPWIKVILTQPSEARG